jgi:hypothetical protein
MLVGNAKVTQEEDVQHFFNRLTQEYSSHWHRNPVSEKIRGFCQKLSAALPSNRNMNFDGHVIVQAYEGHIELMFQLGESPLARKHTIKIYEINGLCMFIAKALTSDHLSKLEERDTKIIEYTWVRNRHVDVVDFLLDPDGGISGRIIHPINSLNWEEFTFCAYILAVEADRLEYIVDREDIL